ncbi:MAG: hypothetical protein CTY16_11070 [Methylobacter sp.]|nr:MAG: hypothetical protein CTY16_11070 [Methylobacter sp.]
MTFFKLQPEKLMKISELTLDQHAQIYNELTNIQVQKTEHELFFTGNHPDLGLCVLFQNGCSNSGTLLQIGVAPTLYPARKLEACNNAPTV